MTERIEAKIRARERISRDEASWLYTQAEDSDLRRLASEVRARFHAPDEASYLLMAIVNYTNVCVARCDYCSFYRLPDQPDGYLLSAAEVCERIDKLVSFGGTMVGFNGGFNPALRIADYAALFREIHTRYPHLQFYELTVAEFMFACKVSKTSYKEGAAILAEAGTRWITGGGSEVLDPGFRKRHSPGKYKVEDYYKAQRAILDAGLGSTATMVIGFDESLEERMNHLERLRAFQDETGGGLASFLCWTYKPWGNALGGEEIDTLSYLRWLAVCRIYLDNFIHVRTSVLTKNEEALRGLAYGANDFDLPTEDEVTQQAGATVSHDFHRILDCAEREGFRPVHRLPLERCPDPARPARPSGQSRLQALTPSTAPRPDVPVQSILRT